MKTAIITGAAKGIGKAISERLISEGYFTILVDIDDENGKKLEKDKEELKQIIEKLKNNGAEAIVLGCTDIPILLQQEDIDIKVFDTVEVLAESTIKFAVKH